MKTFAIIILTSFTANAFAISFGVPGVGSVHIGEGGDPVRPPSGGGGAVGNLLGATISPIPIPGQVMDKKIHQLGDSLSDVITFGQHGRDRDKERAEAAEREAKAVRDGEEKAKGEKRLGLVRSIEIADQNIKDWEDVRSNGPGVIASYERIFTAAQKELVDRTKLDANLRAASNSAKDAGLALKMLTGLLSPAEPQSNDEGETSRKVLSNLIAGGEKLQNVAKTANLSTQEFISRAIATADEASLVQFINLIGTTRAQIVGLVQISSEKLHKAKLTKDGLEKELSSLN